MRGLLIIAAWLYLHAPLLEWMGRTFSHTSFRLNAFLLIGAVALLVWRIGRLPRTELSFEPRANWIALAVASSFASAGLISRRFLDAQMIEAPLFILGSWALLGLFTTGATWRRALVPALVFVSILPFGAQADAYVGFMARVSSARVAASVLGALGVPSMSAETVLVFENGVAQIDAPCSGLRSLWMGSVVFVIALWIERRRLGVRVLAAFVLLLGALLAANVVRVACIVALAVVLKMPGIADVVHVPLGLAGFLVATGIPLMLLHTVGAPSPVPATTAHGARLSPALSFTFALLFAGAGVVPSARPAAASSPKELPLLLPSHWSPQRIELAAAEEDLLARFASGRVAKLRVRRGEHAAAILFVESRSWRSHHPPELCLAGSGHQLREVSERTIAPGFEIRFARLDEGERLHASWFQSGATTHADLVDRIFADLFGRGAPFVMVSVVLDGFEGPEDPDFSSFLIDLRAEVARIHQEHSS